MRATQWRVLKRSFQNSLSVKSVLEVTSNTSGKGPSCRIFEVGNDLLVHGLEQKSCVRGQNFTVMKPSSSSRSSSKPGGEQDHCP